MADTRNLSIEGADAGGSQKIWGQPCLYKELKANQGYIVRLFGKERKMERERSVQKIRISSNKQC